MDEKKAEAEPLGLILEPPQADYDGFAHRLLAACDLWGPWIEGEPRFWAAPAIFSKALEGRLHDAAAQTGRLYQALVDIVWDEPHLLDSFFAMTPVQKRMWHASGGLWHTFARFDCFMCEGNRIQICEINADTPSGQDDAILYNAFMAKENPELEDPNALYEDRLWDAWQLFHQAVTGVPGGPRRVGLIYPTEMPEDITLIHLYARWLASRGVESVMGSPFNLKRRPDGGVSVFGQPVDSVLRHYKTDWWAEREPAWLDEAPYFDTEPLTEPLECLLGAQEAGKVSVINPFGSVLPQNKRAMAFFWEHQDRFEPDLREVIRRYIPQTFRLEHMDRGVLMRERAEWVLKSDYGCEGDEVVLGRSVDDGLWERLLDAARPGRWVAQRFFKIMPLQNRWLPNCGVYLVGGAPVGIFTRLSPSGQMTDQGALVAPSFVDPREK